MSKKSSKSGLLISDDIAGVNQILPHKNKWAWDMYITGFGNNWNPSSIPMQEDIRQWNMPGFLTDDEKLVVRRQLGFFAGSESLVSNNLLLNIFKYITDPECRQYILRQAFEEALHNHTVLYVCDSLNLDYNEVYEAYRNIPSIKAKDDFLMRITSDINRPGFTTTTIEGKRELLRNLITYYIICEGILFFSGFAILLSLGRQNKLPGISQQIQYTLRDESIHIQFGVQVVNAIRKQFPEIWTSEFEKETIQHIESAIKLEVDYAKDVLPNGILGLNAPMFIEYMKYIGNHRLQQIGINHNFGPANNPFAWMTETIELKKNTNFFERHVTDYSEGKVEDDF